MKACFHWASARGNHYSSYERGERIPMGNGQPPAQPANLNRSAKALDLVQFGGIDRQRGPDTGCGWT